MRRRLAICAALCLALALTGLACSKGGTQSPAEDAKLQDMSKKMMEASQGVGGQYGAGQMGGARPGGQGYGPGSMGGGAGGPGGGQGQTAYPGAGQRPQGQ